jgi:hypothetical protein
MTVIALPSSPEPNGVSAKLLNFGRATQPLGGDIQYVSRLGSRYVLQVSLPPMDFETARAWLAARLRAATEGATVTLSWPQPTQSSLGTPLVNGASQLGSSLIADGFTASIAIPQLAYFSFEKDSHTYLHAVTSSGSASGGGAATMNIAPMLRVSPADNAALNFTTPTIEGFMDTGDVEWTMDVLMHIGVSFTITENK